ncbi:MAG: long-chain fatty acid--CoA ligase [Acidobacteria bacterium]|nr:long-chain fatty acid--CoA ligase [Acidobacteriota bacterium]
MKPQTICELFFQAVEKKQNGALFMYKEGGSYKSISALEMKERVEKIGNGLISLGLEFDGKVGILSHNRWEWAAADLGTITAGAADVTIYPTLLPDQVEYILKDSEATMLFVENLTQYEKVKKIRKNCKKLKYIIVMDNTKTDEKDSMTLDELMEKGAEYREKNGADEYRKRAESRKADDLLTLIYTSGTTGNPKGVMLTHGNLASNCIAAGTAVLGEDYYDANDIALSFLPLSHVLERMAGYYLILLLGGCIAYAESIETVPQNMVEVKPTLMVSVPRLYEKMYARIMDMALSGSGLKKKIFFWAVSVGQAASPVLARNGRPSGALGFKYKIAHKLVFSKLQEKTGGRLKFFISGGAPLGREIAEFFLAADLKILEGYGLTETSPVITVNVLKLIKPGTVGPAIPGVEVKIAEDGEILCKGPNVMRGYYNREADTKEVLEPDGWFHTGDIGHLDQDNYLVITDRKKELIVTSGGKNVAPAPIENSLKAIKYVSQAVLIGDKRKFISALIVPDFEALEKWAARNGITYSSISELLKNDKVLDLYNRKIENVNKDLARYEQVKKFTLLEEEMTLETGELTPTLKVKRRIVNERHKDVIDRLYAE